ncbi:MAG TPA: HAMP domain-containing sensor histidine kinase, partial [Frankiaceae bacterium]|nr:HAMP domain-containing sensor histidine kinase [Frankiaceae bacterium]
MTRKLSLRGRMALLVGAAVAAAVAVVALASLLATRAVLGSSIDGELVRQAETTAVSARRLFDGRVLIGGPYAQRLQLVQPDGEAQLPPDQDTLPVDDGDLAVARGASDQHLRTVTVGGVRLRVATVPTPFGAALQVARPLADVDRTLRDLLVVLLVTGLAGVGGAVLLGRLVARAGLRPVDRAAAAAEHVARTQDLSALIPVTGTDEVARLADSLNSMLRALDAARARQRQLVDDASHELRTPLTSLRTNIELLLRAETTPGRTLPGRDREALLRDVEAQLRELSVLVAELVELARDEARPEQVERLDLAEVVGRAVERVKGRAPDVPIRLDARPSPVLGRPHQLERAVANLLDNALKFSPAGGQVWVDVADGEVAVADDGPGIDPADRPHVLDRFYRAAAARGLPGSGLGLAIVADAAHAHGGAVGIGSSPSGGALVRL